MHTESSAGCGGQDSEHFCTSFSLQDWNLLHLLQYYGFLFKLKFSYVYNSCQDPFRDYNEENTKTLEMGNFCRFLRLEMTLASQQLLSVLM